MCNICNNSILDIKNAVDVTSKEFIDKLWEIFGMDANKISVFNPEIVAYIEELLLAEAIPNSIMGVKNIKNFKNNLYNFSLYKTGSFFENVKMIKSLYKDPEKQVQLFESELNTTMGSNLVVEKHQVNHLTETNKVFIDTPSKLLLTYTTEDSKARPMHNKLNGTTLPKTDEKWNRIIKYLSEWNCRCIITESENNVFKDAPVMEKYKESYTISDVDVISGKVITFNENHPCFESDNPILRKQFKKQNW